LVVSHITHFPNTLNKVVVVDWLLVSPSHSVPSTLRYVRSRFGVEVGTRELVCLATWWKILLRHVLAVSA
jgi:hypothetical protein